MDYKVILLVYEFETSKIAAKAVAMITTKILRLAWKMILKLQCQNAQSYLWTHFHSPE